MTPFQLPADLIFNADGALRAGRFAISAIGAADWLEEDKLFVFHGQGLGGALRDALTTQGAFFLVNDGQGKIH